MKPNVLLFIDSFTQGGTERQTIQLTRLLQDTGRYNIHLACLSEKGVLRGEVDALGFRDIPEFPLNSFYGPNTVVQIRRLVSFLREYEIDLVETHDFYTNIFGITGGVLARVPVRIASLRETDGSRSVAQKLVVRRVYDLAHCIVANAEAVRHQLIRDGVRADKVVTIYNGVDTERISPRSNVPREESLAALNLRQKENHRFVTIVANLRPMKDHLTFLKAAQRVRAEFPDALFVIAGDGELSEEVRGLISRLGMADYALMLGRCADVATLLSISDVCVLSSNCGEGFSNSIIEYMAAERPVVATDVGGAREAIVEGQTGFIVGIGDDRGMAERIMFLLGNSQQAREMGKCGLQVVKQKFSCKAQLEQVENLYDRLLSTSRSYFARRSKVVVTTNLKVKASDGNDNKVAQKTK